MSLYFKVLLFSFIIPFIFSFHQKIKFYKFFKQIAASLSLISLFLLFGIFILLKLEFGVSIKTSVLSCYQPTP